MLGYANPVLVGPMCVLSDQGLYIAENMSREIRRDEVNDTYDPYRRVGKRFYRFPDDANAAMIDFEPQQICTGCTDTLWVLTPSEILGLPKVKNSADEWVAGEGGDIIPLELQEN